MISEEIVGVYRVRELALGWIEGLDDKVSHVEGI